MPADYLTVTELAGDQVSVEQVLRLYHRYYWAGNYCRGKDVLEVGCGTGQGVGYIDSLAKSAIFGDCSVELLEIAKRHYGNHYRFEKFDACELPFTENVFDVILILEAIYYIPSIHIFLNECRRVLRPGGKLLIATANKDLYDFNPSPLSHEYYGVVELNNSLSEHHFDTEFFGDISVFDISLRQKILRPIKRLAINASLMPETMDSKKFMKKIVFGKLVEMPYEIEMLEDMTVDPAPVSPCSPDREHKVNFCAASLKENEFGSA